MKISCEIHCETLHYKSERHFFFFGRPPAKFRYVTFFFYAKDFFLLVEENKIAYNQTETYLSKWISY